MQVNGRRLLGLNHKEVVGILKELPQHVRLVCARHKETENYTDQDKIENGYSTYLQSNYSGVNEVSPITERLVKAKSENTLASTDESVLQQMMKNKSRSLEELTNFKMWSIEPVVIELCKGDKGLGFSILDYKVQLTWATFTFTFIALFIVVSLYAKSLMACNQNFKQPDALSKHYFFQS